MVTVCGEFQLMVVKESDVDGRGNIIVAAIGNGDGDGVRSAERQE